MSAVAQTYVEVHSDTSEVPKEIRSSLDSIESAVESSSRAVGDTIERGFRKAADQGTDALGGLRTGAETTGDAVAASIGQGAAKADRELTERFRDSRGRFLPLGTSAEEAAAVIERQFKESARVSDRALEGIDGNGFHRAREGIRSMLAAAGGVYALVTLKDKLQEASAEGAESAKIARVTEAVIRSTGGAANLTAEQVGKYASSLSSITGIDDEAIQAGENILLTFKNVKDGLDPADQIFKRATHSAADLSTVLGGDMSGASVLLGKALNDPIKGISALGRAGVTFTQQQKDQIKTLVESGDILQAQKIILGEVEGQVGSAAVAAADPMKILAVAAGNLKEALGTGLNSAIGPLSASLTDLAVGLEPLVGAIGTGLGTALSALGPSLAQLGKSVAPVLTALAPLLGGVLSSAGKVLASIFATIGPVIERLAPPIGAVIDLLGGVFASTITSLAPVLAKLADALAPVVLILGDALGTALAGIAPLLSELAGALAPVIGSLAGGFASVLQAIAPLLADAGRFLALVAHQLGGKLGQAIAAIMPPLVKMVQVLVTSLRPVLPVLADALGQVVAALADGLADTLVSLAPMLPDLAKALADLVVALVPLIPPLTKLIVLAIEWNNKFNAAVLSKVLPVITAIVEVVAKLVAAVTGADWGKFGDRALAVGQSILGFFSELPGKIAGFFSDLPGRLVDGVRTLGPQLVGVIGRGMASAADAVVDGVTAIAKGLASLPGKVLDLVPEMLSAALSLGGALLRGLGRGVSSAIGGALDLAGAVARAVKSVMNTIIGKINDAFDFTLKGPGPLPDLHVNLPDIPKFAAGTIADRPTFGVFGENGREVVINVDGSRARARQLARDSGLLDLLGTDAPTTGTTTTVGPSHVDQSITVGQVILTKETAPENAIDMLNQVRDHRTEDL